MINIFFINFKSFSIYGYSEPASLSHRSRPHPVQLHIDFGGEALEKCEEFVEECGGVARGRAHGEGEGAVGRWKRVG